MNKIVDFFIRVTTTGILIFTFFLSLPVNTELQPRDEVFLNLEKITQYEINLSAKKYCADTLKDNFGKIHCGTRDSQFLKAEERERDKLALIELNNALIAYKSLEKKIRESNDINSQLVNVLSATENKIFQIEKLLTEPAGNLPNLEYHEIFKGLLIAQGTSYNPYTNRFKALPQNLAQYVISQSEVKRQLKSLEIISNNLHYFFGVLVIISLLLLKGRLKNLGYLLVSFYFLCIFSGLTITRDASLHFGIESSLFDLSPFRQILERQLNISAAAIGLFFICLLGSTPISKLLNISFEKISFIKTTATLMTVTTFAYLFFGPAIGSETFKLSSCIITATLLYRYGRTIELAQERFGIKRLFGQPLNYLSKLEIKSNISRKSINLKDYFSFYVSGKIMFQIFMLGLLIIIVSTVFSDLGGSLIAAAIFTFSLFILLGKNFAIPLIVIFAALCTLIYNISEKIQSRVQLMTEPMKANISDFARLIQFDQGAQPTGYAFGQIKWCSTEGVCLPLQSLSDYMPTLLSGSIGKVYSLLFIVTFALVLLLLTYQCFISAWQNNESKRYLRLVSAMLCMAALFQLIVTVLGNLRVIPLTGLGTPLISIGLSSSITASIGIGLAIGLCFGKK